MSFYQTDSVAFDSRSTSPRKQHYWVKIYANPPFSIDFLGPFESNDIAHQGLCKHIEQLRADGQQCISSFQLLSGTPPSIAHTHMNHREWLQALMEDYLHLKIPFN